MNAAFLSRVLGVVAAAAAVAATAQTYPAKPVTVVVPWPPGGRTDLTARVTAQFMSEAIGQQVVVLNHTGASGVAGAKKVATAAPDGYTLGMFSSGVVATQYTVPTPSDLKEYEPIALINMDAGTVAVNSSAPYKKLADFVAHAKGNPGKVRLGTGVGTSAHLMSALFARAAGIQLLVVPYGGGGGRSAALAGNHIDVDVDVPAIYKSLIEAGKVRLLGLAAEQRSALYADLPTLREQGVDCVMGTWNALFAPRGTPGGVLAALDRAAAAVSQNPRFVEAMNKAFLEVRYMSRDEFGAFLKKEDATIRDLVKELKLEPSSK